MNKFLIKIIPDTDDGKDIYFRRFESENINAIRKALDAAIEKKPRKSRKAAAATEAR